MYVVERICTALGGDLTLKRTKSGEIHVQAAIRVDDKNGAISVGSHSDDMAGNSAS